MQEQNAEYNAGAMVGVAGFGPAVSGPQGHGKP